ncbi:alpha/beta fold hydrolase [Sphaerimonospora thailandensis]|uniref:3-oxoadipate enol-lactone hydrolase n=1 Tax=Sphaerimonospora thailandensis TaxID=795644 RepID=A0A8J3R8H7_9ACTN|nr:alpha/beta hydrolase [Sphaerimonospora thailandensis]GIH67978.1 3-oxoadipate enol-lactone hydrolase [Sphaerimonospora thailandensis]
MPVQLVGNTRVHYTVHGEGPGLVLVHGTGFGSDGTFGHLVDQFTGRTVILPDYSGCGETEDDGGRLTIETLAEQVAGVIEGSGKAPVDLLGFSLGSVVSAAVAATRPDLVRRLILTAGWARPDDEYLKNLMTVWRSMAGDPEAFGRFGTLTAFSRGFLNMIGSEEVENIVRGNQPTDGALRHIDLNLRADIRDLLPEIQAQTLVIGCALDHTVPVEHSREIHAALQGSTYAELDSGHVVVYEKPAEFVALVQEFIDKP